MAIIRHKLIYDITIHDVKDNGSNIVYMNMFIKEKLGLDREDVEYVSIHEDNPKLDTFNMKVYQIYREDEEKTQRLVD